MRTRHPMWAIQTLPSNRLLKPLVSTGMPYLTFTTKKEAKAHILKWNIQQARPAKITVTVQIMDVWG